MASLGDNSIWSSLGDTGASDSVMGPDYSYADHIAGPSSMGVGTDGTMSQLGRNTNGIIEYVKYMISGPALGNQYFVNTGGMCTAPDGSSQPRYNYINNIANGADLLPATMRQELGGLTSDFNGLIPGMLEDIEGLNPVSLFTSLAADSTPSCECYSCPSGGATESRFLNTSMSPDYDPNLCTAVDVSVCKAQGTESFSNRDDYTPLLFGLFLLFLLLL
jgi:hypothetical protein